MWQPFSGDSGLTPAHMSLQGELPDPTWQFFGPNDYFVSDQSARGFARMVDSEARGSLNVDDSRIHLNAKVNNIHYTCDGVIITLEDGREFRGRFAISTLPVGSLQKHHAKLFEPPLEPKQSQALMQYKMCNYTKIFAQWRVPFWNDTSMKWAVGNDGPNAGELPSWRNLNHASVLPGSHTLFWDLAEPQSSVWEARSDIEAQAMLMRRVRALYGDVPEPLDFHMTRHAYDPLSYGAYTGWATNFTEEIFEALSAPLRRSGECIPRVFLSGEGMCGNFNGFVHGALLAGRKASGQVLQAMGFAPSVDSACDWQSLRLRNAWRPRPPLLSSLTV